MSRVLAAIWFGVAALELLFIAQPGSPMGQLALSIGIIVLLLLMRVLRLDKTWRHIFLALATVLVLRYAYWRTTSTLPPVSDLASFVPGVLLYAGEMYAILMLGISLFVISDPVDRAAPPPVDTETAPRVDVLVPSYNEPVEILAMTLAAAKRMTYPADRLTITLLDDGATTEKLQSADRAIALSAKRRAKELKDLCARLGVSYHARERNLHAKAGNLNSGLSVTTGELVVVFDADHAPERNFLTETVGYFLTDPRLFLVQTPHFFTNPDPIERNLGTFERMPSENEMFYGRIQKGLDRWNAAFFCGSAAVLRRKALEEAGGFSGITVTEDCETALELHSRGWNSIYVDKPLVCGLQPETFSALIGQRARWCRGMVQILLLKNPLFKRGLNLAQRVGYLSNAMFWLFPYARLSFFVAPLLFILFNLKIYVSSMEEFFAYALTYLIASEIIRSSLYGRVRWPWISELYEYVQSIFLLPAILAVIVSPRKPSFNVTAKGEDMSRDRLSELSLPYFGIFSVCLVGMAVCIYRYQTEPEISGLLAVAGLWQLLNLLIAAAGLGIVAERADRRSANRIDADKPVILLLDGVQHEARLVDVSARGAALVLASETPLHRPEGDVATLLIETDEAAPASLSVTLAGIDDGGRLGVGFAPGIEDYGLIADLMLGDMEPVRKRRAARRTYRGMLQGTLDLLVWAIASPARFVSLALSRSPDPEEQARISGAAPLKPTVELA